MGLKEKKLRARAEELRDQLIEEVLRSDTPSKDVLWLLGLEHLAAIALAASQYVDIPTGLWHAIDACDQACCKPPRPGEEQYLAVMSYLEYFIAESENHFEARK